MEKMDIKTPKVISDVANDKRKLTIVIGISVLVLFIAGLYYFLFSAPRKFPAGQEITIEKGWSANQVASYLKDKSVIRSIYAFKLLSEFSGGQKIIAGDYLFKDSLNVFSISRRLLNGQFGIEKVKVTIPEGLDNEAVAALLKAKLPDFNQRKFILIAGNKEGMLFPDTYFIKPKESEEQILQDMLNNFKSQTAQFSTDLENFHRPMSEILVMASLIEKEAKTADQQRIISGILWKRISLGMKLQVDAVFPYIMDKYSLELSLKDLNFNSPYNTYRYAGLPPSPICNPGLDSIKAALHPAKTNYLYYLSDKNSVMHYAATFAEHKINKAKYLP